MAHGDVSSGLSVLGFPRIEILASPLWVYNYLGKLSC